MLKNIPGLLSPELLKVMREMGHGDELVIVDANYPATSAGPIVIRLDGLTATDVTDAVLQLLPLDDFVDLAAFCMQVVGEPDKRVPIMDEFSALLERHDTCTKLGTLERFEFYARANNGYAIVQTGERRLYGNIILKKGVVRAE